MKFRNLIIKKDYEGIAWRLQKEFGLFEVPIADIIHVVSTSLRDTCYISLYGTQRTEAWSDQSWKSWFKIRLQFYGMFDVETAVKDDWEEPRTATMHIFFPYLEESPEMMARLSGEDEEVGKSGPARHRLGKVTTDISPINKTALRVAPPPRGETNDT